MLDLRVRFCRFLLESCNRNLIRSEEFSGYILPSVESNFFYIYYSKSHSYLQLTVMYAYKNVTRHKFTVCSILPPPPPPPVLIRWYTNSARRILVSTFRKGCASLGRINVPWALNPGWWLHSNHHIKMDSACTRTNGPRAHKLRGIIICRHVW